MIPVRMYQDEDSLHGETFFLNCRGWFRSTDLWVMGPARFLYATLLNKS